MVFKRLEDIIVSSLILILISPILLVISAAVKTTSKGPVIFAGTLWNGRKTYKSLEISLDDCDGKRRQSYSGYKNDIRVTKVGKFYAVLP